MAQHALAQVPLAAEGVDQRAVAAFGHRVDRQVAARQVLLQRDGRVGVHDEAVVARRALALGARQCVFLVRVRVQEHREVAPHLLEAGVEHLLRRGTDHDPVAVVDRPPEQPVAHRAADDVGLQCGGRVARHRQRGVFEPGPGAAPFGSAASCRATSAIRASMAWR